MLGLTKTLWTAGLYAEALRINSIENFEKERISFFYSYVILKHFVIRKR